MSVYVSAYRSSFVCMPVLFGGWIVDCMFIGPMLVISWPLGGLYEDLCIGLCTSVCAWCLFVWVRVYTYSDMSSSVTR